MWSSPDPALSPAAEVTRRFLGRAVAWDPEDLTGPLDGYFQEERESSDAPNALDPAEAAALDEAERERALAEEIERRVAEAYAMGLEDGRRDGAAAEASRLRTSIEAAEAALDAVREGEARWNGGIEENICALAIAVAKQVLERELRGSPRVVSELVRRAIAVFPIDQPIRIRVAPSDLAMITSAGADTSPSPLTGAREVRWIADPLVTPGGCVIEGRERIIDGRVDSALERLYRRLTHTSA